MKIISVKTFYLEMRRRPNYEAASPFPNCAVMQASRPTASFYKYLYGAVGKEWLWVNRLMMKEEDLAAIINDPLVEVYVLYVDGVPAGYAELDRRIEGEVELAYFGLLPEFIGRGLGKYLLRWAVKLAWEHDPNRIWLHTCELDHPAALPNYLKAGFVVFKEEIIQQRLPEEI